MNSLFIRCKRGGNLAYKYIIRGLSRNPVGTSEIRDDKGIDGIVLAQVDKGLFIVADDLRIQTVNQSVERSQDFTGG